MIFLKAQSSLVSNDVATFGILITLLAIIFTSAQSKHPVLRKLYTIFPPLLLCYFIPSLLTSFHIISIDNTELYKIASRYLLPASLVLFTIGVDFKELWKLRHQAGLMFLTGAIGIIIGGPLAMLIVSSFSPETVGGEGADATWRGLATVSGSWIGGTANMTALYEVFKPSPALYSSMVMLDVVIASSWMAVLLYGAGFTKKIDRFLKADVSTVEKLKDKVESYQQGLLRIPSVNDLLLILGIAFGVTGFAYLVADNIVPFISRKAPYLEKLSLTSVFFWVVIISTLIGSILSFTNIRKLEGAGASRIGNIFLYLLIAAIGMQMDLLAIFKSPGVLVVGAIWLLIHILLLVLVARLMKIPFFFLAVSSEACLGGAAQSSVVAAAFHPALAPVGVLLAIFGYVFGNYGGYLCGLLLQWVA